MEKLLDIVNPGFADAEAIRVTLCESAEALKGTDDVVAEGCAVATERAEHMRAVAVRRLFLVGLGVAALVVWKWRKSK